MLHLYISMGPDGFFSISHPIYNSQIARWISESQIKYETKQN
jgi:hypothetical protein